MRSRNLNRKYSKSKSLNLNCGAKNIFNRQDLLATNLYKFDGLTALQLDHDAR